MDRRDSALGTRDSGATRASQRGRSSRRLLLVLAVLAALGAGAWLLLRPEPAGPSVTERARTNAGAAALDSLSARHIAGEDLPPAGTRSLFDHLIAQNESLPYPFEKLVALIQSRDPQNRAPLALMIPQGRSLLKAQADYAHPRILVAADFQAPGSEAELGLAPRGQLFLGFVENAREIEVISYNEAAGRFEFQLVRDYAADGQRRIVYARRAVCTTCHQGAAPIFPQRPWNETNAQPDVSQQIVAARGPEDYLGVPVYNALGVPERFDELTDVANFIPVTQRLWLDGCGDGAEGARCRRLMLKLALRHASNPGAFDASSADAAELRRLQARAFPAAGIAVPESDIRNRDPLGESKGLRGWWHDLVTRKARPGEGARDNEDLEAFERLPKLPADLDPLTPRPPKRVLAAGDLDGVYGLAALLTPDDLDRLEARAGYAWGQVEAGVDALPDAFFEPRPFARVATLQALLGGALRDARRPATAGAVPAYCCLDTVEMSPPVAIGEPPLTLAAGSPLEPYRDYCFACHRGNPSRRLDFMSGASEAEVLARIRETGAIRDALDWERYKGTDKANTLMPPADSAQRARLEAALAQDPQLLEQMRSQVPALFEF